MVKCLTSDGYLKFYKDDGKESISGDSPKEISLDTFLKEVENIPQSYTDNFIGLINDKDETIQFVRLGQDTWLIDVPVLQGGAYLYSLEDGNLTTEKVKQISRNFYSGTDWKSLCNLKPVKT